jgi:hypothetical protein
MGEDRPVTHQSNSGKLALRSVRLTSLQINVSFFSFSEPSNGIEKNQKRKKEKLNFICFFFFSFFQVDFYIVIGRRRTIEI